MVDESSLASTTQMRDLLRIATTLRVPRVALVGDEKQLDGVEAGKPFAQLKRAGMQTVVMDEIVRQRDADLKDAVRAGLRREIGGAWKQRTSGDKPRDYLSVQLDDPSFAEPIRTALFEDDEGAAVLVWNRREG